MQDGLQSVATGLSARQVVVGLRMDWGLLGLAVLAKGPVGFLLPAASLGLFLLVMNEPAVRPFPAR